MYERNQPLLFLCEWPSLSYLLALSASSTHPEQIETLEPLAGDHCYHFHFAQESCLGRRQAWRNRQRHYELESQ